MGSKLILIVTFPIMIDINLLANEPNYKRVVITDNSINWFTPDSTLTGQIIYCAFPPPGLENPPNLSGEYTLLGIGFSNPNLHQYMVGLI